MDSTIRLLEKFLLYLYICFIVAILATLGSLVSGIVLASTFHSGIMLWISASSIIFFLLAIICKGYINLVNESIIEHSNIIDRFRRIEKELSDERNMLTKAREESVKTNEKISIVEKTIGKEEQKSLKATNEISNNVVRIKHEDVIISTNSILFNGIPHNLKEIKHLSVVGNELHFLIESTKYIIVCSYYSEASQLFDDITPFLGN